MSNEDFCAFYPDEDHYVEWKEGVGRVALQEAIVAFSNADGGVVLIGVADDGTVLGKPLDPGVEKAIWELVSEIRSPGTVRLDELVVGQHRITVISVEQRLQGLSQTSDGRPVQRRGKQNLALVGDQLIRLLSTRTPDSFDGAASRWDMEDADQSLLEALLAAIGIDPSPTEVGDALNTRGLTVREGSKWKLTNAGALYLIKEVSVALGKCRVDIFRYRPDATEYDLRREFEGTPAEQVISVVEWLQEELGADLVVIGRTRFELDRLPAKAIREVVANAVAHRDYQLTGSAIEIRLTPTELVVTSPGGFVEPVTRENLEHAHAARNNSVISILRAFGLAEDAGRGIRVILDEMASGMLGMPTFEEEVSGHVTVRLPIESPVSAEERAWVRQHENRGHLFPEDRRVLIEAARGAELTNADVRELINADSRQARLSLQRLRDLGFLDQSGERGGARYTLSTEFRPPAGIKLDRRGLRRRVLQLAEDGAITNTTVRAEMGLSRYEVRDLLAELVADGELELRGSKRGAHYVVPEPQEMRLL